MSKKLYLFYGLLFLVVLFLSSISAANPLCWIETNSATCAGNGGHVIMHFSATTNAHGELANMVSYSNVLCCNFGNGSTTCSSTLDQFTNQPINKILGLSSSTNAHAEIPGLITPIYLNDNVCYDSLQYARRVDSVLNCNTLNNEIPVLYISDTTNAHIEGSGLSPQNYQSKICAVVNQTLPPPPGGNHTECQNNMCVSVTGDGVNACLPVNQPCMPGTHSICVGKTCMSAVGPGSNQCASSADCMNNADQHSVCQNNMCTVVDGAGNNECDPIGAACVPTHGVCTLNSASWGVTQTIQGRSVSLNVATSNCDGQTISFTISKQGTPCTSITGCTNPDNVVVSGNNAIGTWTAYPGDDDNNYTFKATLTSTGAYKQSSNTLQVYTEIPPQCESVVTCANYLNEQTCSDDMCSVASNSVPPEQVDCGASGISCFCFWNFQTSTCEGAWSSTNPLNPTDHIGTCYYQETSTDTCQDDGYLTVNLAANWQWASGNPGHNDPQNLAANCKSSVETFQCPAQIPLPFFDWYNLVVALVVIACVYLILLLKKRRR